jgi:U4/U6.U5 tri-snRNP component SNU23
VDADEEQQQQQQPKRRADLLDFESQINRVQVVQSTTLASKQAGFYCEACNQVFKDNQAFLEHVNSRMRKLLGVW